MNDERRTTPRRFFERVGATARDDFGPDFTLDFATKTPSYGDVLWVRSVSYGIVAEPLSPVRRARPSRDPRSPRRVLRRSPSRRAESRSRNARKQSFAGKRDSNDPSVKKASRSGNARLSAGSDRSRVERNRRRRENRTTEPHAVSRRRVPPRGCRSPLVPPRGARCTIRRRRVPPARRRAWRSGGAWTARFPRRRRARGRARGVTRCLTTAGTSPALWTCTPRRTFREDLRGIPNRRTRRCKTALSPSPALCLRTTPTRAKASPRWRAKLLSTARCASSSSARATSTLPFDVKTSDAFRCFPSVSRRAIQSSGVFRRSRFPPLDPDSDPDPGPSASTDSVSPARATRTPAHTRVAPRCLPDAL